MKAEVLLLPFTLILLMVGVQQHIQIPLFAALERQWPNPNSRRQTMTSRPTIDYGTDGDSITNTTIIRTDDVLDEHDIDADIPEAPILASDTLDDGFNVYIDVGLAMTPNGHHAIKVAMHGNGTLTAAQANRLHNVLDLASRVVAGARQDPGYTS